MNDGQDNIHNQNHTQIQFYLQTTYTKNKQLNELDNNTKIFSFQYNFQTNNSLL